MTKTSFPLHEGVEINNADVFDEYIYLKSEDPDPTEKDSFRQPVPGIRVVNEKAKQKNRNKAKAARKARRR